MTYVIGWRDEHNVYMIADSALSSVSQSQDRTQTSFGEIEKTYHNYMVKEGALKLSILHQEYLISYAGMMPSIYSALEFIQQNLELGLTIYEVLTYLSNSFTSDEYKLLIGFYDERPILLHYDGKETTEHDIVQLGSGAVLFGDLFIRFIQKHLQSGDPSWKLVTMISYIQCQSIMDGLIEYGVGGNFAGARVCHEGIHWCSDMTYCLYEDDLAMVRTVTVMARNNCIFVSTDYKTKSPNNIFFGWNLNDEEFLENWKKHGLSMLDDLKSDFYIFYSPVRQNLRIIYCNKKVQNDYFRLWVKNTDEQLHSFLALSEKLGEELKAPNSIGFLMATPFPYMTRKDYVIRFNDQAIVPDYEDEGYR
ncbi:hypothetical protein [Paenibacillus ihumii]|uniref:hypothetical protein n=1 Tax=Paenibacillus ihumii TaxID=687436 RepID=UPI0006D76742|nr:hypothetical protein [Paenibacillus ihumii]